MISIGELSRRTGVKVPTIRYYEAAGLLPEPGRTAGGQRRYDAAGVERLAFIRHGRDLGFSIEAIEALITLQEHPDRSCDAARKIALDQLAEVQDRIARLTALERELTRLSEGCGGDGQTADCYVLASLADHGLCSADH